MSSKSEKIKSLSTEDSLLTIWLEDGRIMSLPLAWYPTLRDALPAERSLWQPSGAGRGIHWPALDYDLSIAGLIQGLKEHPNARQFSRQTRIKRKATLQLPAHLRVLPSARPKAKKRSAALPAYS